MVKSMVAGNVKKRLEIERIRQSKLPAPIFMTLHGATGTDDDDLRQAIAAGITVVHINTQVRLAWRHGLDAILRKQPDEIVPYKLFPQVVGSVREVVAARLDLFSTLHRVRSASG
jgi:fructose-bisphosphate aldolase, class II